MTSEKAAPAGIPSADQLRMSILAKEMAEMEKQEKVRAQKDQQLRDFTETFLTRAGQR